jgi:hypothetical protein
MAHFGRDNLAMQSRLRRSVWIYGRYQLAGLALSGLSILSMLVADRSMLSREPKLALLYVAVLAVPVGVWGLVKAVRFYSAAARPGIDADVRAG